MRPLELGVRSPVHPGKRGGKQAQEKLTEPATRGAATWLDRIVRGSGLEIRNCQAGVSPKSHTGRTIDFGAAIFRDRGADF